MKLGVKQLVNGVATEAERRAGARWPMSRRNDRHEEGADPASKGRLASGWPAIVAIGKAARHPKRSGRATGGCASASAAALVLDRRRRRDRLRVAEAPRRRPQRRRGLQAAEAEKAGDEDGPLADLRLRPRPHPVPAGRRGGAAVPQALALHRAAAARVPADRRRRQALPGQQQRLRDLARRRHRQGALEAADRHPQRLLAGLLPAPPLHRQPRPRPHRQARREDRQDHLETLPAGSRRVLAAGDRPQRLLRRRRRQPLLAEHAQRQRALGDAAGRRRSSRRPPTTAARSTSATTAAT